MTRRFDDPSPWCRARAAQKRACPRCGKRLGFRPTAFNPNAGYDECEACGYFQTVAAPPAARVDYVPATDEEVAEVNRRGLAEMVERGAAERRRRETAAKCAAILRMTAGR